ncbi:hypothetical protein Airi02_035260 [Actinoallomurus iriomotensis]|uniref:Uncharacterized protein n=1 Tax=Actinoallomurus iriomotensis TaxID=478107 RepID=A0A9W6W0B4_9ACTN|nr:hypothetical protein Airi02_035260 [Actinoallomurus iriomotensis]
MNVLPGFIPTDGTIAHDRRIAESRDAGLEETQRDLATSLNGLLGKPGPEEAAELIVFLASGRGRRLTGARYRVDGGILPMVWRAPSSLGGEEVEPEADQEQEDARPPQAVIRLRLVQ